MTTQAKIVPVQVNRRAKRQRGIGTMDVFTALGIFSVAVIGIIFLVRPEMLKNDARAVGSALANAATDIKILGKSTGGNLPYSGVTNASSLIPSIENNGLFRIDGTTVIHGLGGGTAGTVVAVPAAYGTGGAGSAAGFNATNVNRVACPILADYFAAFSGAVTVNAEVVKSTSAGTASVYNAAAARAACTSGDSNTVSSVFDR